MIKYHKIDQYFSSLVEVTILIFLIMITITTLNVNFTNVVILIVIINIIIEHHTTNIDSVYLGDVIHPPYYGTSQWGPITIKLQLFSIIIFAFYIIIRGVAL